MPNLKMAQSFNDVWVYDVGSSRWSEIVCNQALTRRSQHVAGLLGSIMLVHGGYNCEAKITLDDFQCFDLDLKRWIKTYVINAHNSKVTESGSNLYGIDSTRTLDSDDSGHDDRVPQIGHRRGHSLASVHLDQTLKSHPGLQSWITRSRVREFAEGFYMFGGQGKEDVELMNDLWLIRPFYMRNLGSIDINTLKYKSKRPELTLTIEKVTEYSGQAPCPRYGATMVHLHL